jgi:hypothetical protein
MSKQYGPKWGNLVDARYREESVDEQRELYRFIDFVSGTITVKSVSTIEVPNDAENGDAYFIPNDSGISSGPWIDSDNKIRIYRTNVNSGTTNTVLDPFWELYTIPNFSEIIDSSTDIKYFYKNDELIPINNLYAINLDEDLYGDFNNSLWGTLNTGVYVGDFDNLKISNYFANLNGTRQRFTAFITNTDSTYVITIYSRADNNPSDYLVYTRNAISFSCAVSF